MWRNLISGSAYQWRFVRAVIRISGTIVMFLCCKTHVSTGEANNKMKLIFLSTDTCTIVQNIARYFQPMIDRILADSLVLCRKELSTNPP